MFVGQKTQCYKDENSPNWYVPSVYIKISIGFLVCNQLTLKFI